MPRRGRSMSPAPARRSSVPAAAPMRAAAPPQPQQQQQQPGLFKQMAATAAGVAVGSAVGHTMGAALTGGYGNEAAQQQPQQPQPSNPAPSQQQYQNGPCQFELKQFMECASNQPDLSLCQGFNEVLKQCKMQYGLQM